MKSFSKVFAALAVCGALAAMAFVGAASAAVPLAATASAGCTPVTNIEAIIDDSGSMEITDPNKLRVQAMDLLVKTLAGGDDFGGGGIRVGV